MNWKLLRAGERRQLARHLSETRGTRQIGYAAFKLLVAVLLVFGLSAIVAAAETHTGGHGAGILAAAAPAVFIGGKGDFLEVMDEAEKMETNLRSRSQVVPNFEAKLDKFIRLIANESGMPSHRRTFLMREAETTSDFPILFGTVLERTLAARYSIVKPDWRTYVKVGAQNDFRKNNLLNVFGLESSMEQVPQRGEYKNDTLSEGKVENRLFKYGRQFNLSWEDIINDDLGAFSDIAARLANAAIVTETKEATKLFVAAAGPNTSLIGNSITCPLDGSVIDNLTTDLLSIDHIGDAITAMRQFKDANGNPIEFTRFHLVVPPALEIPALKALSNGALIAAAGATGSFVQTSENIVAKLPITLHVNAYIPIICTAANKDKMWWIFGENSGTSTPAVQMNFLRGHEQPEIVQKLSNKISLGGGAVSALEGDFETDSAAWRLRHVLGGTQVDPRMAYASDGSGS